MEVSLRETLKSSGPLAPKEAATLLSGLMRKLQELHTRKYIHGNISPELIFIDTDQGVRLADWEALATPAGFSGPGEVLESFRYISPEQARGQPPGPRSDLFVVGLVLWEMLTGEKALNHETLSEISRAVSAGPIPAPSDRRPEIPRALDDLCGALLAPDPESRFTSAQEVITALEAYLDDT